jgi:hypothetical protein
MFQSRFEFLDVCECCTMIPYLRAVVPALWLGIHVHLRTSLNFLVFLFGGTTPLPLLVPSPHWTTARFSCLPGIRRKPRTTKLIRSESSSWCSWMNSGIVRRHLGLPGTASVVNIRWPCAFVVHAFLVFPVVTSVAQLPVSTMICPGVMLLRACSVVIHRTMTLQKTERKRTPFCWIACNLCDLEPVRMSVLIPVSAFSFSSASQNKMKPFIFKSVACN